MYELKRVTKAEQTDDFRNLLKKKERQSKIAQKAVMTKTNKLDDELSKLKIEVFVMGEKEVIEAAVRSFNEWQEYKADVTGNYDLLENCASVEDDDDFLKRITVNYIRHNLMEYDNVIENTLKGKTGKNKL